MFKKRKKLDEREIVYSYNLPPEGDYNNMDSQDDICTRLVLQLFDLFGFAQGIVLYFYRADNLDEVVKFQKQFPCRVIRDVTRSDRFCVFIPEVQSNIVLNAIMNDDGLFGGNDYQYIPQITSLEEFLFSQSSFSFKAGKNEIIYKLASFSASLNHDRISLSFDKEQWEIEYIESVLAEWENTFGDLKFKRSTY